MPPKRNINPRLFSLFRKTIKPTTARNSLQVSDVRTQIQLEKWVADRRYTEPDSTLEGVAEAIGVAPNQLSYYFRVVLGISFQTWRKKLRIRDAKVLMAQFPEKSIASIGASVGIVDKSNFRRQFLEETGETPMQYRNSLLGNVK